MAAELEQAMERPTVNAVKDLNEEEFTHSCVVDTLQKAAEHFSLSNGDGDLFLVAAQQSLEEKESVALLDCLKDPERQDLLNFVGWDLVKVVFQFLPDSDIEVNHCETILHLICNTCNPREICLSLGELLSRQLAWQKLVILLRLLRETCQRLVGKVAKIFSSILSSLTKCLKNTEHIFDHLSEILQMTLDFLRPLVEKIQNWDPQSSRSEEANELKEALEFFFITLLEYPLALLEFPVPHKDEEPNNSCNEFCNFRKFAEIVIEFLGYVECNSFKGLFEYGVYQNKHKQQSAGSFDGESYDEERVLSYIGLGSLAFLVHVEKIGARFVPVVVTGRYCLETAIVYINVMLSCDEVKVISKGVRLLLAVLSMVESGTLDHYLLENDEVFKLAEILTKLMTHCEDTSIRQGSVQGLRGMVDKFEQRGRYKLLRCLNQGCTHSGFAELLTLILKEEIVKSLQGSIDDEWFLGRNVASFLQEIFRIPAKVLKSEHGIVEERSQILSALNLCRFLLIRDTENKTKIHTMFSELQKNYLKPLMDAVIFSKARLKSTIKEKQDEISGRVPPKAQAVDKEFISVETPDGCKLEEGSLEDQLRLLESSSLTVDIIESILVRIGEICEDKGLQKT